MPQRFSAWRVCAAAAAATLSACAGLPHHGGQDAMPSTAFETANRLSWGANAPTTARIAAETATDGPGAYLARQLRPGPAVLPPAVQRQIAAMAISQRPLDALVRDMDQRIRASNQLPDSEEKRATRLAWQQDMNRLAREAASRHLLRALYSSNQLQEQMTWFWLNHFNVHQAKANLRAMVGDYEESAIRPHALGRFRELLGAVAHHPAMLRYLDNAQNAAGHINENYARELLELHTLGVEGGGIGGGIGGGYSQQDVQEMARVLTGVGVSDKSEPPNVRRELQADYVRRGLFEFNPSRHDYGAKQLLGAPIKSRGLAELDEALDRLARHPSTARSISSKLARYWLADEPPPALVEHMAQTFLRSDGDIAATLQALMSSAEFARGAGQKFKDPVRYVVSAVRLAYGDGEGNGQTVQNVGPMLNWLNRLGEPLYGHATPDGYALDAAAWSSPGQMATRFEIARIIGSGNAGLFRAEGASPPERAEPPVRPQLANALFERAIGPTLGEPTRAALAQAKSPQEWNSFFLSSPEFMNR